MVGFIWLEGGRVYAPSMGYQPTAAWREGVWFLLPLCAANNKQPTAALEYRMVRSGVRAYSLFRGIATDALFLSFALGKLVLRLTFGREWRFA